MAETDFEFKSYCNSFIKEISDSKLDFETALDYMKEKYDIEIDQQYSDHKNNVILLMARFMTLFLLEDGLYHGDDDDKITIQFLMETFWNHDDEIYVNFVRRIFCREELSNDKGLDSHELFKRIRHCDGFVIRPRMKTLSRFVSETNVDVINALDLTTLKELYKQKLLDALFIGQELNRAMRGKAK